MKPPTSITPPRPRHGKTLSRLGLRRICLARSSAGQRARTGGNGAGLLLLRLGTCVPTLWERDSHAMGTSFPRLGNSIPTPWEQDSQSKGRCWEYYIVYFQPVITAPFCSSPAPSATMTLPGSGTPTATCPAASAHNG